MKTIEEMVQVLKDYDGEPITLMEVCGTHTGAIAQNGIKSLLSPKISLVSGPGCPVCVTTPEYIDGLCYLAKQENTCVLSFGDMLRVPGTRQSLKEAMAEGAKVIMVYSPFEVITMAKEHPEITYVFAAVGFETTTPIYAMILKEAIENNLTNLKIHTALKTMPEAIAYICKENTKIEGFIAPGHVCTITGSKEYEDLGKAYGLPFVVAGFTADQVIAALYLLLKIRGTFKVYNLYQEVVTEEGNERAKSLVGTYFEPCDAEWRGIGLIQGSGLKVREEYRHFTMEKELLQVAERLCQRDEKEEAESKSRQSSCICSQILLGKALPTDCQLFKNGSCTPEHPIGACMVSVEGTCNCYKRGAI